MHVQLFLLYVLTQANEKYMGDALLQKTYTVDFLTKKRVKNTGMVPQYYVEGNHEAIIPKSIFFKVQEELARRANLHKPSMTKKKREEKSKYSAKYALSQLLVCKECGHPYRRQVWTRNGEKTAVWRCENRLKNGTKKCKKSPTLKEVYVHEAIMKALHKVVENQGSFVGAFRENVIMVIGGYAENKATIEYDQPIASLEQKILELIEENAKENSKKDADKDAIKKEFDTKYQQISKEIKALKTKRCNAIRNQEKADDLIKRIEEVEDCLGTVSHEVRDFDEDLIRRLLVKIMVISPYKIELHFKSGIIMVQEVNDLED